MSQSLYSSLSLQSNTIRLLRILPNENEEADINCTLFVYPLHDSGRGTHRYEALSYVWGDADNSRSICVNGHSLTVRANLHIALSRLRDPVLDRIIWIDAICINQEDLNERGHQVQLMAKIYSKASQVVVWLGEAADNSDRALEEIVVAANQSEISSNETTRTAVLALLQRPWFRRIWVLQEVAAARHILIMCGLVEIDGYAFCSGLNLWKDLFEAYPRFQRLIRSVIYLMKEANLRPKYAKSSSEDFSLDIRPLSELIETYYTRESTDDLDKVYALLAMCSDNPTSAGLLPDYTIPWEQLFQQLIQFVLCKEIDVKIPRDRNKAIFRAKGCALGWVISVKVDVAWNDAVKVDIVSTDALKYLERTNESMVTWNLPTMEKDIQKGDIIYLLQGVLKPMIIRFSKDHFSVIMIAASPKWAQDVRPKMTFPRDFSLVWDLGQSEKNLRPIYSTTEEASETNESQRTRTDLETEERYPPNSPSSSLEDYEIRKTQETYKRTLRHRGPMNLPTIYRDRPEYLERRGNPEMGPSSSIAEYLEEGKYLDLDYYLETGWKTLDEATALCNFALLLKDFKEYKHVEKLLLHVLRTRKQLQGIEHPQTLIGIADLQSYYQERGYLKGTEELEAMKHLLETGESAAQVSKEDVVNIASLSSCKAMMLLFERREGHVPITEEAVKAAAANEYCGSDMMELFLKNREDLLITEEIFQVAVGNMTKRYDIMNLLSDRRKNQILITEEIVKIVASDREEGLRMLRWFSELSGDQVPLTEEIIKIAAANEYGGNMILKYLFEKSRNQISITEEIIKIAAANKHEGNTILTHLFERGGNQIPVTAETVKAAAGNKSGGGILLKYLFERGGDQIPITEDIIKAAAGDHFRGSLISKYLFEKSGNYISITEETIEAATDNHCRGYNILKYLFEKSGNCISITEEIVKIAAGNRWEGYNILKLFFETKGDQLPITEEVLKTAAGNEQDGHSILKLFFETKGDQLSITEEVLRIAAGNEGEESYVMDLLFEKKGSQLPITEEVLKTAAGNEQNGYSILKLFFETKGDQLPITEEVLKAAAGNEQDGHRLIKLFFETKGDQLPITENIVKEAVGNRNYGHNIMGLLFEKKGSQLPITEEILKIAAGNGCYAYKIIEVFFEIKGDQLPITEEILKAAVGNEGLDGDELISILFGRLGGQFPITEEVLKVAAGNKGYSGEEMMMYLFKKFGHQFPITEETLEEILELAAKKWEPDLVKRLSTWKLKGHGN